MGPGPVRPMSLADALDEIVERVVRDAGDVRDRAEVWSLVARWAMFMAAHEAALARGGAGS